ncbi:MAG: glycine zipper 2TM domain-containing protein [Altererythrobacter sp.]|nr:glycine zipper 2TM domain-containing protein [Altererythrobacter sp.]
MTLAAPASAVSITPAPVATTPATALGMTAVAYGDRDDRYDRRGDHGRRDYRDNRGYDRYGNYPGYRGQAYPPRGYYNNAPNYNYCRRSSGTTGMIVGGGAGALLGREVAGRYGDRTLGAVIGAAGGALLGRSLDRGVRC